MVVWIWRVSVGVAGLDGWTDGWHRERASGRRATSSRNQRASRHHSSSKVCTCVRPHALRKALAVGCRAAGMGGRFRPGDWHVPHVRITSVYLPGRSCGVFLSLDRTKGATQPAGSSLTHSSISRPPNTSTQRGHKPDRSNRKRRSERGRVGRGRRRRRPRRRRRLPNKSASSSVLLLRREPFCRRLDDPPRPAP